MLKSLTKCILTALTIIYSLFSLFQAIPSYAANNNVVTGSGGTNSSNASNTSLPKDACDTTTDEELRKAFGCPDSPVEEDLPATIARIVRNIIFVCGLVAVIFIVIGGINFITSEGDGNKIKKAKDTVLYAMIGLIICTLTFLIVNWVIGSILEQGAAEQQTIEDNPTTEQQTIEEEPTTEPIEI